MAPLKMQSAQVGDPATQRNFEQIEGLFPLAAEFLGNGSVTAAALADGAIVEGSSLRAVVGCVTSAGAVLFGSGFSVVHNTTGKWTVTLSPAFPDANYATLLTCFAGASGIGIASLRNDVSYTPSQFGVHTINSTAFADLTFMFACLGRR